MNIRNIIRINHGLFNLFCYHMFHCCGPRRDLYRSQVKNATVNLFVRKQVAVVLLLLTVAVGQCGRKVCASREKQN